MDTLQSLRGRIDMLESRTAHQDRTIDDLNTTVTDLWRQIDALSRKVGRLGDQLKAAQASAGGTEPPEPPPPHY